MLVVKYSACFYPLNRSVFWVLVSKSVRWIFKKNSQRAMIFPQMLYKLVLYLLSFSYKTDDQARERVFHFKTPLRLLVISAKRTDKFEVYERFMSKKQMLQIRVFLLPFSHETNFNLKFKTKNVLFRCTC